MKHRPAALSTCFHEGLVGLRSLFLTCASDDAAGYPGGYSAVTMSNSSRNRDTCGMVRERVVVMWIAESFLGWIVFGIVLHF
jgi:hypothetical protein